MTNNLQNERRASAEQPFSWASYDSHLPGVAAQVGDNAVARAKVLAAGLKTRLRSANQPAPVVEAAYLLEESRSPDCPLLERIRILGLLASVLDHFFSEQAQALTESKREEITAQLDRLLQRAFVELDETLLPALAEEYGFEIGFPHELEGPQRDYLRRFFRQQFYPMLTPLAVDPGHPFPFISSHSINLLVHLSSPDFGTGPLSYARIKVPRLMSRFVAVPSAEGQRLFIWSEDAVAGFLNELFPGMKIESVSLFRLLRASNGGRSRDELEAQSRGLRNQKLASPVVRLEFETAMPDAVVEWLASHLPVPLQLCFRSSGPLAMFQLVDLANLAHTWG